ncbi:hypothetical protein CDD83_1101 [Cordyceps sp. RAO-2017]|nr:hypothetical protein CDD83_1101 [Cordyceps sp. RAO-2017]
MKPIFAIPLTAALVVRAWQKKSLTPAGIVAGVLTAVAHAYHPWNLPLVLLVVFFFAGTRVTHIKENVKATLTLHSRGTSGGEGPRTHVQVFANSLMGSILSLLHAHQLRARAAAYADPEASSPSGSMCYSWGGDVLVVGIIANYAAVAADTFSSELGILSRSQPRLVTSPTLRKVPRGTNGGVTAEGLAAGLFGSMVVVTTAMLFLPACSSDTAPTVGGGPPWSMTQRRLFMAFLVVWGALGSLLDSVLGGILQRSVLDVRSGKIVEGEGGNRVLVSASASQVVGGSTKRAEARAAALEGRGGGGGGGGGQGARGSDTSAVADVEEEDEAARRGSAAGQKHRKASFGDERPSRVVANGWDLLDNNDVNFLMASTMSIGGMALASWYWGVPINDVMRP